MNVHVIIERSSDPGRRDQPVAVLLQPGGLNHFQYAIECPLIESAVHKTLIQAFNEVSRLSDAARAQLELSDADIASLKTQAQGEDFQPGTRVSVCMYYEDGKARVEGVFIGADKRATSTFTEFKLASDMQEHQREQRREAAAREVQALSPETRKILQGLRKAGP